MMKATLSTQIHAAKSYADYQIMAINHSKQEDLSSESHFALTTADSIKHSLSTNRDVMRVSPFMTVSSPNTSADTLQVDNAVTNTQNTVSEKMLYDSPNQQNSSKIDYFFDNFHQIVRVTFVPQQHHNSQLDSKQKMLNYLGKEINNSNQQQPVMKVLQPVFDRLIQEVNLQNISSSSNITRARCASSSSDNNIAYDYPPRTRSSSQVSQVSQSTNSHMFPNTLQSLASQQTKQPQFLANYSLRNKVINEEESFLQPYPSNEFDSSFRISQNVTAHNPIISQQSTHTYQMMSIPSEKSISSFDKSQQPNTYSTQQRISIQQQQQPSTSTSNLPPNYSTSSQPFSSLLPPPGPSIRTNKNSKPQDQNITISQQRNTVYHHPPLPPHPPLPQSTRVQLNGYTTNHCNPSRLKQGHSQRDKENWHDSQNLIINLCDNPLIPLSFQPNQASSCSFSSSNSNLNIRNHSSFSKNTIPPANISSNSIIQNSQQAVQQNQIIQKVPKNTCGQFFHTPSTHSSMPLNNSKEQHSNYSVNSNSNSNNNIRYPIVKKPTYQQSNSIRQHSVSSQDGSYNDCSDTIQIIPYTQYPFQQARIIPQQFATFTEEGSLHQRISQRLRTESTYLPDRQETQQEMQQQCIPPVMGSRMRAVSVNVSEQTTRGQPNRQQNSQASQNSNNNHELILSQNSQYIQLDNYLANGTITYLPNAQINTAINNTNNQSSFQNTSNSSNSSNNNRNTSIPRSVPVISRHNSLQSSMQRDHSLPKISNNNAQANLISSLQQKQHPGVFADSFAANGRRIPQAPRLSSSYSLHNNQC